MKLTRFVRTCVDVVGHGNAAYWTWVVGLLSLMIWGGLAYWDQLTRGMIVTNMRDQVSWAFYVGNFTFLPDGTVVEHGLDRFDPALCIALAP